MDIQPESWAQAFPSPSGGISGRSQKVCADFGQRFAPYGLFRTEYRLSSPWAALCDGPAAVPWRTGRYRPRAQSEPAVSDDKEQASRPADRRESPYVLVDHEADPVVPARWRVQPGEAGLAGCVAEISEPHSSISAQSRILVTDDDRLY